MEGQTLLFFKLTLLIGRTLAEHCDRANTARVREGNLGQSSDFNWLGVLHVHLHEWDQLRIAMSGIVLIKIKYALANADDVVRIPQNIFKANSRAMFLVARNTPWFVKPASYVTHPEYEYSTLNTIAIVKLNLDEVDDFPLTPICLPDADTFHASRYLYLTGFTDDNQMLEKVIYKIQYLDKKVCEDFYNRAVMPSQQLIPSAYLCGYAPNSVTQCVWENGMVLVSNASGYYNLIGFGVHGPGCAAPARFIDLFPYFSWIKSVSSPGEVYDAGYRRKEDANKFIQNVPIHELYTMKGSRRHGVLSHHDFEHYPFDVDALKFQLIEPAMDNEHTLLIIPFVDTWQAHKDACLNDSVLMYKEYFELKAVAGMKGTATYKLSLYDLAYATCSCVRLTIDSEARSDAKLSFKEQINPKENIELRENSWETPEELFKHFSVYERTEKPEKITKLEDIKHLLEPDYIKDREHLLRKVMNYDLYIKIEFNARAIMQFEMFATPMNRSVGWLLPTTEKAETTTLSKISEPTKPTAMTTTTKPVRRRAKSREKKWPSSRWGMVNWEDKMLKKAEVSLEADVKEVQQTESAARSEGAPGAAVIVCCLVSACLRRAFIIY